MVLIRIIAWFVALIQAFLFDIGLTKPENFLSEVNALMNSIQNVEMTDKAENGFADTVAYAQSVKNVVAASYTDSLRNGFMITNGDMIFKHTLTADEKSATLTDKQGNAYIADSFKSFYTDKLGVKHYFEKSSENGRVNVIRLGEYYYECHIRDFESGSFYIDKCFHTFADKIYLEYALLADKATKAFKDYGSEITIPASTVSAIEIKDAAGLHNDVKNLDENSIEYAAFDISGVGVVGFIIPADGSTQKVTVQKKGADYIITQYGFYDGKGLNKYDETGEYENYKISFGCRIYTDKTHAFDGIRKENYNEKNPLELTVLNSDAEYTGYEALRGTYTVKIDGPARGFNQAYYDEPDKHYKAEIKIKGDEADRNVYVRTHCTVTGCLEGASILDENGRLAAVDVEVCKNFQGDGGEPVYSKNDYLYSDTFTPVAVKENEDTQFTVLNVYQNWGKYPLKQVSSIEFFTAYYHLSTGTTESNCIAPYFVFGKDGWILPDFRNASGTMWPTQPQFNSVGILKFMTYRDAAIKGTAMSEFTGSKIDSTGLTFADITDFYTDDNGKYDYSLRHLEMPQPDENRTYYSLKVDFKDDVTYADFKKDFDLFYFDGRYTAFNKFGYIDENNSHITGDVSKDETYHTLGTEAPFMGFYSVTDKTAPRITESNFGCNFALIIKDSKIIAGGQEQNIPFVFKEHGDAEFTTGVLTLDAEELTFKKGDSIEIDLILLPWGIGTETNDANVLKVREDSALKAVKTTAAVGTVKDDTYLPTVKAANGIAEFTVSGGRGNITVKADGFKSMNRPEIYTLSGGEWVEYDISSVNGYDGYSVHANYDGTYSFSFVFASEGPETSRSFKVVQK